MDLVLEQVVVEGRDSSLFQTVRKKQELQTQNNRALDWDDTTFGIYIKNCSALDDAGKNHYQAVFGLAPIPPNSLPPQPPGGAGQVAAPQPEVQGQVREAAPPEVQVPGAALEAAPPEAPQPIPSHQLISQQLALTRPLFPSPQMGPSPRL
ncbi:hypothetical protein ACJRO7_023003 [Eucalyptus globulus]|uniref:Uncharacterized protein n=1 Tax=Eucalyptus globulus TaxID=34317 RepID=A0ABD3K5F9_EUCGL